MEYKSSTSILNQPNFLRVIYRADIRLGTYTPPGKRKCRKSFFLSLMLAWLHNGIRSMSGRLSEPLKTKPGDVTPLIWIPATGHEPTSHPPSQLISIVTSSFIIFLVSPSGLFPRPFPTSIFYAFPLTHPPPLPQIPVRPIATLNFSVPLHN